MNVSLYADAGVIQKNPSTLGGMYAWVLVNEKNKSIAQDAVFVSPKLFGGKVTNNNVELLAIIRGLAYAQANKLYVTHVYSDSEVSLGRLFYGYSWREVAGYVEEQRKGITINGAKPVLLNGHPTKKQLQEGIGRTGRPVSKWNVYCDKLCTETGKAYMRGDFYV
jgi:ribonuclease HI